MGALVDVCFFLVYRRLVSERRCHLHYIANGFVVCNCRWVPGGSLSAVLEQFGGQFEPSLIRRYLVHLLGGLEYLHEHMIVHRDIKGENVLVSEDGTAKLADFGASKRLGPDGTLCESHHSLKGTP